MVDPLFYKEAPPQVSVPDGNIAEIIKERMASPISAQFVLSTAAIHSS